ncbi:eukaryotic aspartyl protease family protein [Striga asiatica]|uniref:Eukaryotic aspartyl protease family protein n=1 Tax=Striga asiatica TaxID=4170 RepID=A0A5A7QH51_STRAF|nr:eukaryotic aspartyl protease family protein [Striga asiatica]
MLVKEKLGGFKFRKLVSCSGHRITSIHLSLRNDHPPGLKKRQSSAVVEVIHKDSPFADELLLKNQTKSSQPSLGDQSRLVLRLHAFPVVTYGDGSVTTGYLDKDKLTIAPSKAFSDFAFGCSLFTQGLWGLEAGLVGLGKGPISLVSQTAKKYGGCFSYCLQTTSSSKGFLLLGKDNYDHTTKFTPLILRTKHPTYYIFNIIGIAMEGRNLSANMPPLHTIVDSGAAISL